MFRLIEPQNTDIVFSPNGRYMAVSGEKSFVQVWKVDDWSELPCLRHEHKVYSIAFSPDSEYIATASFDKTAIWRTSGLQEVARLTHNEDIRAVVFSPDGKYVATVGMNGNTTFWLWQPDDLVNEACKRLSRNLTAEEWQEFLGDEPYRLTCPSSINVDSELVPTEVSF